MLRKINTNRAARFDPNMHEIVCRLGLRPRPYWGAYSAPTDPLAVFMGPAYKLRGEEGLEKERLGREFVLCPIGRKKKSRLLWSTSLTIQHDARGSSIVAPNGGLTMMPIMPWHGAPR